MIELRAGIVFMLIDLRPFAFVTDLLPFDFDVARGRVLIAEFEGVEEEVVKSR
jgi:hypothetical protein